MRRPAPAAAAAFASVSIGGTSPSGFKSDRAFDIAGFKLAGLLQQVLGAHIVVKVSSNVKGVCEGPTPTTSADPAACLWSLEGGCDGSRARAHYLCRPCAVLACLPAVPPPPHPAPPDTPLLMPQIVSLVMFGAPVIWAWGALYAAITGAPIGLGVFKIYTVVLRAPGARVTEETSVGKGGLVFPANPVNSPYHLQPWTTVCVCADPACPCLLALACTCS